MEDKFQNLTYLSLNSTIITFAILSKLLISDFPFPYVQQKDNRGFGGAYCVPVIPLPSILKDDFNGNLHPDLWPEVYGAERGNLNGETIKSGTSLIFKGVR